MPMLAFAVAMTTSQQPSNDALPAKQRPDVMPTIGTSPLSSAKRPNVGTPPESPLVSVSPGRPPPPSANSTTGMRPDCATPIMRSVFAWLRAPCVPARTV